MYIFDLTIDFLGELHAKKESSWDMEFEGPLHRPSTEIVTLLVELMHLYIVTRRKHWYINYYVLFCIMI